MLHIFTDSSINNTWCTMVTTSWHYNSTNQWKDIGGRYLRWTTEPCRTICRVLTDISDRWRRIWWGRRGWGRLDIKKNCKVQNIRPTLFSPTCEKLLFDWFWMCPELQYRLYILYENVYSPMFWIFQLSIVRIKVL